MEHGAAWLRALLIATSMVLGGCGGEPVPPVRIGINPWPGYEFLWLAQRHGDFAAEGVAVELVEYGSLDDVRRGYETGQVDGMASTLVEVAFVRATTARVPQVIMVSDYSDGADVILARAGIDTLHDLRGMRIGLEVASLNALLLARALSRVGLALNEVRLLPMSQLELGDALGNDAVDVVVTYPPTSLALLAHHRLTPLFSSAEMPGELLDVVSLDHEILEARPEVAAGIRRGFFRARRRFEDDPVASGAEMASREGISASDFAETLRDGVRLLGEDEQAAMLHGRGRVESSLARATSTLRAAGLLPAINPMDDATVAVAAPREAP